MEHIAWGILYSPKSRSNSQRVEDREADTENLCDKKETPSPNAMNRKEYRRNFIKLLVTMSFSSDLVVSRVDLAIFDH